jgi:hypothetical protein
MDNDRARLFLANDFGQAVTYKAPDGLQTALTCVVFDEYTEDVDQLGVNTRKRMRGCAINRSELATVNQRATMTIGTIEYSINRVISQDDQITVVELSRHEVVDQTRPGYRRQT